MLLDNDMYDDLMAWAEVLPEPHEGQLVISGQTVMQSAAGWYVGTFCLERMGDQWFGQPYSRDSDYFSNPKNAQKLRDYWNDESGFELEDE